MDSYGVIEIGSSMLSIPGLIFYLLFTSVCVLLGLKLVNRTVPKSQRLLNYFTIGICSAVIATWAVIFFGLWFYV